MTDSGGFVATDLHGVADRIGAGITGLAGMADQPPSAPNAGRSSATIAGVLSALGGVVGLVLDTADTATGYVRTGSDAYRDTDRECAQAFGRANRG